MERIITIGGKEMRMRASALIPRLYRFKFGRDVIADFNKLRKNFAAAVKAQQAETDDDVEAAHLSVLDLTIFENLTWLLMWHADSTSVPETPDEWLDSIDGVFSVYDVLPEVIDLWDASTATTSTPVKK